MSRDELERKFWLGLRALGLDQRARVPALNIIDNWLDAAESFASEQLSEYLSASDRTRA